jgi:hypothetical protein
MSFRNREHRQRGKLNKNPAALIAAILIAISGFIFPLFNSQMFGENLPNKKGIMFNFIIDLFTGKLSISTAYEIAIIGMILVYLIILILYLLNGFGVIYNRYSRYASILSVVYLFLGLISVVLINRETLVEFFNITFTSTTIGLGTYLIPIIGIAYLFLVRWINRIIRF